MGTLELTQFIVKEHAGTFKVLDAYDIFDATTQQKVALARETPARWVTVLRPVMAKKQLPTDITVTGGDEGGPVLFQIRRPFALFRSPDVGVYDGSGTQVGCFVEKFAWSKGFWIHDVHDKQMAEVKGNWKGRDFKLLGPGGEVLGSVSKKWGGLATELFTSADTYIVALNESLRGNRETTILLLAAALAIDVIYGERGDEA